MPPGQVAPVGPQWEAALWAAHCPTQDTWVWRWGQGCSHPLSLGGHLGLRHGLCLGCRVRLPTGCPEAAGCPTSLASSPETQAPGGTLFCSQTSACWPPRYLLNICIKSARFFLDYFERKRAGAELSTRTPEGGAGTRAAHCRADGQVQVWADPSAALDFGMWPSLLCQLSLSLSDHECRL